MTECTTCDGSRGGYMKHIRAIKRLGVAEAGLPCMESRKAHAAYLKEWRKTKDR